MPIYVYECERANCRQVTEQHCKRIPDTVPDTVPCAKCGHRAVRSYRMEQGHLRQGDLPDWTSVHGGVLPNQVDEASREYADLGVTFDRNGDAHVPGGVREKYLKRRGLGELHSAPCLRRRRHTA